SVPPQPGAHQAPDAAPPRSAPTGRARVPAHAAPEPEPEHEPRRLTAIPPRPVLPSRTMAPPRAPTSPPRTPTPPAPTPPPPAPSPSIGRPRVIEGAIVEESPPAHAAAPSRPASSAPAARPEPYPLGTGADPTYVISTGRESGYPPPRAATVPPVDVERTQRVPPAEALTRPAGRAET